MLTKTQVTIYSVKTTANRWAVRLIIGMLFFIQAINADAFTLIDILRIAREMGLLDPPPTATFIPTAIPTPTFEPTATPVPVPNVYITDSLVGEISDRVDGVDTDTFAERSLVINWLDPLQAQAADYHVIVSLDGGVNYEFLGNTQSNQERYLIWQPDNEQISETYRSGPLHGQTYLFSVFRMEPQADNTFTAVFIGGSNPVEMILTDIPTATNTPEPININTPVPPTNTPTQEPEPTDTPSPIIYTPTNTPTIIVPTNTPTIAIPTNTPTIVIPTATPIGYVWFEGSVQDILGTGNISGVTVNVIPDLYSINDLMQNGPSSAQVIDGTHAITDSSGFYKIGLKESTVAGLNGGAIRIYTTGPVWDGTTLPYKALEGIINAPAVSKAAFPRRELDGFNLMYKNDAFGRHRVTFNSEDHDGNMSMDPRIPWFIVTSKYPGSNKPSNSDIDNALLFIDKLKSASYEKYKDTQFLIGTEEEIVNHYEGFENMPENFIYFNWVDKMDKLGAVQEGEVYNDNKHIFMNRTFDVGTIKHFRVLDTSQGWGFSDEQLKELSLSTIFQEGLTVAYPNREPSRGLLFPTKNDTIFHEAAIMPYPTNFDENCFKITTNGHIAGEFFYNVSRNVQTPAPK